MHNLQTMPNLIEPQNIRDHIPQMGRVIGLDVGSKTIGLALGDIQSGIVTPLKTIRRKKFTHDIRVLGDIIKQYDEVCGFVIGLPLNMDGSEGPRAQSIRDFARELINYPQYIGADSWIGFWDERLSTNAVEDFAPDYLGINKFKAKEQGIVDQLAASVILQQVMGL